MKIKLSINVKIKNRYLIKINVGFPNTFMMIISILTNNEIQFPII